MFIQHVLPAEIGGKWRAECLNTRLPLLTYLATCGIQCDAEKGFFFIPSGHHGRRHRVRDREAENSDLPSINEVKHFKIPDVFTQAKSTRQADDEPEDNNEVNM